MHSGDQQPSAAEEDQSLAAELQRRASCHHKSDDEEAGTGWDRKKPETFPVLIGSRVQHELLKWRDDG